MVGAAPGHAEPTALVSTTADAPLPIENGVAQPGTVFGMDLHGSASTTAGCGEVGARAPRWRARARGAGNA